MFYSHGFDACSLSVLVLALTIAVTVDAEDLSLFIHRTFDIVNTRWPSGPWLVAALADAGPGAVVCFMLWEE